MIKNFDFFQKIAVDQIQQSTLIGALLSIIAITIMSFLLLRETYLFLNPEIIKETLIYQYSAVDEKILINFEIQLYNVPCAILSTDQEDDIGHHEMDIIENLEKIRIDKQQRIIQGHYPSEYIDLISRSIEEDEGCYIRATIPITKAPGNVHFSFHNYRDHFYYLLTNRPELLAKIKMNHRILSLSFGNSTINEKILDKYGLNEHTETFKKYRNFPTFQNSNVSLNYDYYIKLIPHIFYDETTGEEIHTYQYSINNNLRALEDIDEMPVVSFIYDFSPISMKIVKTKKNLTRTLTHIFAIVGGVFFIFSFLNSFIDAILEKDERKSYYKQENSK